MTTPSEAIVFGTPDNPSKRQRKLMRRIYNGSDYHVKASDWQQFISFGWISSELISTPTVYAVTMQYFVTELGMQVAFQGRDPNHGRQSANGDRKYFKGRMSR